MSRGVALSLLVGFLAATASAEEDENWNRLRAMPREQRVVLNAKISEFDRLDRHERDSIRALDRKVEALPSADRAHYQSVLQNYHQWLRSLPEEKRQAIAATPPGDRFALVTRLRAEEAAAHKPSPADPLDLRLERLRGPSPQSLARLLKTWLELTPAEKQDVEKRDLGLRTKRLLELAEQKKIRLQHLDISREQLKELAARIEAHPKGKELLDVPARALAGEKKGIPAEKLEDRIAKNRLRLLENYYTLLYPPSAVNPENLFRFEKELPAWVASALDVLPPDEAKRRLTMLYRLVFPSGEMPDPKAVRKADTAKPAPPKSREKPAPSPPPTPPPL